MTIVLLGIVLGAVQLAAGIVIGRYLVIGRGRHPHHEPSDLEPFARRLYGLVTGTTSEADEPQRAEPLGECLDDRLVDRQDQPPVDRQSGTGATAKPLAEAVFRLVAKVIRLNRRLQSRLSEAQAKIRRQSEQIQHHVEEARTDTLTGLLNRRALDDELNRRISQWHRHRTPCCLMMVDIDHFKNLNDRHGHPNGDQVLRVVAGILLDAVREMDIVTRFGGEEFVVVLPDTNLADAEVVTERVRLSVQTSRIQIEGRRMPVTISSGLAATVQGDDAASLVSRADEALYLSKHAGRNCSHSCRPSGCERIELELGPAPGPAVLGEDTSPEPMLDAELEVACDELRERLAEFTNGS